MQCDAFLLDDMQCCFANVREIGAIQLVKKLWQRKGILHWCHTTAAVLVREAAPVAIQIQRFGGSVCAPQLCDVGIVTTAPVVSVTVKEMDAFSQNLFACFLRFQSAAVLLLIRNLASGQIQNGIRI